MVQWGLRRSVARNSDVTMSPSGVEGISFAPLGGVGRRRVTMYKGFGCGVKRIWGWRFRIKIDVKLMVHFLSNSPALVGIFLFLFLLAHAKSGSEKLLIVFLQGPFINLLR